MVRVPPLPLMKSVVVPVPPRITLPVPASVTFPLVDSKVLFPVLSSVIVPLLVIVPVSVVVVLLPTMRLPDVVRLVKETLSLVIVPVPIADNVPPVMLVPLRSTDEPACALMVAPVFVQDWPVSSRVPPLLASMSLVLVEAALGLISKVWPLTLALMVELLTSAIWVLPTVPKPLSGWSRVSVPPLPLMKSAAPTPPSTTLPLPFRVTFPLAVRIVLLPVLSKVSVPPLLRVPTSVVVPLFPITMLAEFVRLLNVLLTLVMVPAPVCVMPFQVLPVEV